MFRAVRSGLLNFATAVSLALAIMLTALWGRSYWYLDTITHDSQLERRKDVNMFNPMLNPEGKVWYSGHDQRRHSLGSQGGVLYYYHHFKEWADDAHLDTVPIGLKRDSVRGGVEDRRTWQGYDRFYFGGFGFERGGASDDWADKGTRRGATSYRQWFAVFAPHWTVILICAALPAARAIRRRRKGGRG